MENDGAITEILRRLEREGGRLGGGDAVDLLVPAVYGELKRLARSRLGRKGSRAGHLDTTSLVHEAYLKLSAGEGAFNDRGHFFAVAAKAMRQVVVDEARRSMAEKRGGSQRPLTLDENLLPVTSGAPDLVALDDALDRLEELSPRLARVVEYRFFVGLTEEEIGKRLDLTARTVRRDWTKARAWLHRELRAGSG